MGFVISTCVHDKIIKARSLHKFWTSLLQNCTQLENIVRMGLPYSKQINAAFEQVTPLVAAGFQVLQTTKNISLLLAVIQVLTVILLAFIFAELFALLITLNPNLEEEREALVTPAVKWVTEFVLQILGYQKTFISICGILIIGVCIGSAAGLYYTASDPTLMIEEDRSEGAAIDAEAGEMSEQK